MSPKLNVGRHRGAAMIVGLLPTFFAVTPLVAQPAITNLGVLPGCASSHATAVSAHGLTVVGASDGIAFRWTRDGGMQPVPMLPGVLISSAQAVTDDGLGITGNCNTANGRRGFRWIRNFGTEDLGVLADGTRTEASGISGNGVAVSGTSGTINGIQAFRWISGGGMQDLGFLPGGTTSEGFAISRNGSVVVGNSSTATAGFHAFRWTSGGGMRDLGVLSGGALSTARAVSSTGSGVAGYGTAFGGYRAFRWTGLMQNLGVTPGAVNSYGYAISGDASIVGGYQDMLNGARHACLWSSATGMVDLNVFLPTLGVDLAGWVLTETWGISVEGSAIVGSGTFGGLPRAWLVNGLWGSGSGPPGLCPADFNADGSLNGDDLGDFINCYFQQTVSSGMRRG